MLDVSALIHNICRVPVHFYVLGIIPINDESATTRLLYSN